MRNSKVAASAILPAPVSSATHSAISLTDIATRKEIPENIGDVRNALAFRNINVGNIERDAASHYRFDGRFVRGADGNPVRILGNRRIGVPPINFLNRGVGAGEVLGLTLFLIAVMASFFAVEYGIIRAGGGAEMADRLAPLIAGGASSFVALVSIPAAINECVGAVSRASYRNRLDGDLRRALSRDLNPEPSIRLPKNSIGTIFSEAVVNDVVEVPFIRDPDNIFSEQEIKEAGDWVSTVKKISRPRFVSETNGLARKFVDIVGRSFGSPVGKKDLCDAINFIFDEGAPRAAFADADQEKEFCDLKREIRQNMIDGKTEFRDAKLYQFCFLSQVARVAKVREGAIVYSDFKELREDFNKRFAEYATATYGAEEAEKFVTSTLIPISEGFIATGMVGNGTRDSGLDLLAEYALNLRDGDRALSPHPELSGARYYNIAEIADFRRQIFGMEGGVSLAEGLRPNLSSVAKRYEDGMGGELDHKEERRAKPSPGEEEDDAVVRIFSAAASSMASPIAAGMPKDDEVRLDVAAPRAKDAANSAFDEKYSSSDDEASEYVSIVVRPAATPSVPAPTMVDTTGARVVQVAPRQSTRAPGGDA